MSTGYAVLVAARQRHTDSILERLPIPIKDALVAAGLTGAGALAEVGALNEEERSQGCP